MMETINIPLPLALTLSALTLLCAFAVIPYLLTCYNTEWLPSWIRPDIDIVDVPYPNYYPANESRTVLAVSLFLAFLCTAVAGCMDGTDTKADRREEPDIQELGREVGRVLEQNVMLQQETRRQQYNKNK